MSGTLGATIQSLSILGYSLAGQFLGVPYQFYRPSGSAAPIVTANLIASIVSDFTSDAKTAYAAPSMVTKPQQYGLLDVTALLPGDYAVGQRGTLFMQSSEPNVASMWIECNVVLSGARPGENLANTDRGSLPGYGGVNRSVEKSQIAAGTALFSGWPASILAGTKGANSTTKLPSDERQPWWAILLPVSLPQRLQYGDQLFAATGEVYTISSAELTALGWRVTAALDTV